MVAVALTAGCGDNASVPRDSRSDGPSVDAPLYPPCGNVVRGTAVSFREIGQLGDGQVAMLATSPPNDPRLFVVEQHGTIHIFKDEVLQPEPFIDLRQAMPPLVGPTAPGNENGLLGLAFHPNYASNGLFFVVYNTNPDTFSENIVRCRVSASNPDKADPAECVTLMAFPHPFTNHEGGMAEFGRDGYLYVSLGDGGAGGDRSGNGQNPNTVLAKMLRLDVDNKAPGMEYGIPADNPFASGGGAPEVFMLGLRNPWRWSFDRGTGDMWIGDVGQEMAEELNVLRPHEQRGANLGWSIYEGNICCQSPPGDPTFHCALPGDPSSCSPTGMTFPRVAYDRAAGWQSIIAGQVYRGSCFPDLYGWFYYTDWERQELARARLHADDTFESHDVGVKTPPGPSSLHADARGELYLTTSFGGVYRLEVTPP